MMRSVPGLGLALACLVSVLSASRLPAHQAGTVSDSAGVHIVSIPARSLGFVPLVRATERFRTIGDVTLYHVTDAVFLPDGRLAVANAGSQHVVFLDAAGAVDWRYGREGEGPGEFSSIRALGVTADGALWAYDDRLGRLTEIPASGGEPRTRPLRPDDRITSLEPLLVDWDGPVLAIRGEHRVFRSGGESRDTVPLFLVDAQGETRDTIGWWPGREKAFVGLNGGSGQLQIGFGRDVFTGARANTAVIGSSDVLDLSVFDGDGELVMKIVGGGSPVRVTKEAAEAWRRERVEGLSDHPEFAAAYEDVRISDTYPAFDGLGVDADDRVWVGLHSAGAETGTWWIVGRDGPEGAVAVPAIGSVVAVSSDRLAVHARTELGEEYIVVYDIETIPNEETDP